MGHRERGRIEIDRRSFIVGGAGLAVASCAGASAGHPVRRWLEAAREKRWVVAYRSSADSGEPRHPTTIVVRLGDVDRIAYLETHDDGAIGTPVLSPDGSMIALRKDQRVGGVVTAHIWALPAVESAPLRSVLELRPMMGFGRSLTGTNAAWSHDNRRLLVSARPLADPAGQVFGDRLLLVDVETATFTELLALGRRRLLSAPITSQAWSPDNRRFVFVDADGHVIIADTTMATREDLGPGMYPTWSPDGRGITLQEYEARPKPDDPLGGQIRAFASNYVLVDIKPPHRRRLLFANPTRLLGSRQGYFGPAVWAPDSRLLVLGLLGPWLLTWFVLDSDTGDLQRLPDIPAGNEFTVGGRV